MVCKSLALLCLCLAVRVSSMRTSEKLSVNDTDANIEESELGCQDYCVQCNDGSTVWYGRSRSWFKSFVHLFTSGVLVPITNVMSMIMKGTREDVSFTGYLPTTGLFCEKVDIVKFPAEKEEPLAYTPLMLADASLFGRIKLNELKVTDRYPKPWAQIGDKEAYAGCRIAKASGLKGSATQFVSTFQSDCDNSVIHGVLECSRHSRLCGAVGVKKFMKGVSTWDQCNAQKKNFDAPGMCPNLP
jgi:hypothetical protein